MMAAGRAPPTSRAPEVEFGTAEDFFERARAEYPDAPVWNGELYLELHRGTYSAQLGTKQGAAAARHLLHEAELLATLAAPAPSTLTPRRARRAVGGHAAEPVPRHPPRLIAWVHREAEAQHAALAERAERIIGSSLAALAAAGGRARAMRQVRPTGATRCC